MNEVPLYESVSSSEPRASAVVSGLALKGFKAHRLVYHSTLVLRVIKRIGLALTGRCLSRVNA